MARPSTVLRGADAALSWMLVLIAFVFSTSLSSNASAELKYSKIDAATVRVFAYKGVTVERLKAKSGRAYVLAIPDAGHGSGLIVSADGLVLTARHVVEDARMVAVQLPGQDRPLPARVIYADEERDHAFLAIPGRHESFVEIPKAGPKLAVRDAVYVVGYPLDASRDRPQSQQGIVSGVLKDGSLQLGVALNPGNSGGPVVDPKEQLLGIAVARADPRAGAQGIGVAVPVEHILEGYKRALKSDALDDARKELRSASSSETREVELVVSFLTSEDAQSSFRALDGEADADAGSRLAEKWLEGEKSPSADALSLAAAEQWNTVAALWDRNQRDEDRLEKARELARRAVDADSDVTERSPFVQFVVDGHDPTDITAGLPGGGEGEEGVGPPGEFDELMNSLETSKTLPMLRIGPTLGITTPFQVFGIGVVAKMLFADAININARYQFGWHPVDSELETSHLFEVTGGYAFATWNGTTTARLIVDVDHAVGRTTYHYVPGKVPTVHALVAEAGVLSGPVNLLADPIADPTASTVEMMRQIFIIEAGIRYTYFYQAESDYLANAARSTVELSAHLLAPPIGVPDGRNNADGDSIGSIPGFKGEVAWGSAPLSWGLTEIGAGYMPAGDWIYLRFGWTYLFY